METKKRIRFPILFKVIFLGIITSFVASSIAIAVSYSNMINRARNDLDISANEALEYANNYYTDPDLASLNLPAFKYVRDYVLDIYSNSDAYKYKSLGDFDTFAEYEAYNSKFFPYFYADGMFMTMDYPVFRTNYIAINQILLNSSFYSDQASYYAIKDPDNPERFIFICDSRHSTYKYSGKFYHCPGSHYDIKPTDSIFDIGHEYIKGYNLSRYSTRFIEIKETNDEGGYDVIGYVFVEYETATVIDSYRPILINEILVLSASSLAVIIIYAVLSYFLFVKNVNKLNKAALDISSQLEHNKSITVIDPNIKSHDEMYTLGESIVAMENRIDNYIDIIKSDAREKEKINAELDIASKIQLDALPKSQFDDDKVSIRAFMESAKEVGGDFYDYFYIDENRMAVIISDVSGKGIPAALFMMKSKELIKSKLSGNTDLAEAVYEVNNLLSANNDESLFVTSFIGVINYKKETIYYVNAGHEKPYILSNNNVIKLDGNSNFVLGAEADLPYVVEEHKFTKGDIIFMYTDGLSESINDDKEEFYYQRIEDCLKESLGASIDEYISNMNKKLSSFTGDNEPFDDVTMVVARLNNNKLNLSFDKKDYSVIEETVDSFNKTFPYIDEGRKGKVGIILDELLNNLITYEKREDLCIEVNFLYQNDDIEITIKANGSDYDPFLNHKDKYLEDFSHDVEEGGFGVLLVKDLSKETSYSYKNGHSIVIVKL